MNTILPSLRRHELMRRPAWHLFDRFFEDFGWPTMFMEEETWTPPLDFYETEDELVVRLEVPGMDKKDVNINLSEGILTISGEKKPEEVENETCHCMESCYGKFSRSIRIPFGVDTDKVDASLKHGVLKVRLPRSEAAKPRHIEIKS